MPLLVNKKLELDVDVDTVFSCVMPYIRDVDDRNSLSLVSRKFYELEGITREQVTVHVHYAPTTSRLSHRFPNIQSLTLVGLLNKYEDPVFKVTPWILELSVSFKCLNALCIRDMYVDDEDLELLGKTRGKDLRLLKINGGPGVSESGLLHVAKYCNRLRTFCFREIFMKRVDVCPNWLRELALHNKVIESLHFSIRINGYDWEDRFDEDDLTFLAKNCSKSLVSLKIDPCHLSELGEAFRHAVRLEDCYGAYFDKDDEYVGFKFPPNMHSLGIYDLPERCPFVLPLGNQLRELRFRFTGFACRCLLIERCPNLEVLHSDDICGDSGLQVIGQVCKKLRKLTYYRKVTHLGLIPLAQGCCNLEYLDVILKSKSMTNEALECIGTHLKNLVDFKMNMGVKTYRTVFPLDNGIRTLLNGCSKLERLDIRLFSGGLTDIGLGYIGKYGHNLKYLCLGKIVESETGIVELSKGCSKLRKLEILNFPWKCQSVLDTADILFNIPSLRYLWFYHISGIFVRTRPDFEAFWEGSDALCSDFKC